MSGGDPLEGLAGGRLLAMPDSAKVLGPARLRFSGGRIASAEAVPADALSGHERGLLLMPTLANAHDHGWGLRPLAFGAADDSLEMWLPALSRNPALDPYLRALVAFARMAQSGVGAANHCHNTQDSGSLLAEAQGVSRAAREAGVRIGFAMPFFDRNATVYGDRGRLLDRLDADDRTAAAVPPIMRPLAVNLALMEQIAAFEHDHFILQYGPVSPQWTEHATLAAIAEGSAASGRRIHMHLLETRRQREWADAQYPGGLIPFLDSLGLLSPRLTVAHGVWLRPGECERLGERGVSLSLNPSSNLRLRSGAAPAADILAAGIRFGIGMDGLSFDDDDDMLRELRLAWRLNGGLGQDRTLGAGRLLGAACRDGRRTIVGDDGGGVIAPGAPADILAIDFDSLAYDCIDDDIDPVSLLLARATRGHVARVIVAGREIVRAGRCVTVDLPAAEAELIAAARASRPLPASTQPRIERLQSALGDYYRCGCHMLGPGQV